MANTTEKKNFWHKIFATTPNDGDVQPKEGIAFSIAGFGQNMICTIIGSYITVFMTDAIGYPALSVALLMLFARIYDAFNDPIMGSIVDRTRTKWGKCRPYLKWMPIPIAIMTIICFLPVYPGATLVDGVWVWDPKSTAGFAAMSAMYIIWGMVYTVADVPYWSLVTCMTDDTYKRSNLLSVARLICTAGAGVVTIILPQITGAVQTAHAGNLPAIANGLKWTYFAAAIIVSVLAVPMFFYGFKHTKERSVNTEEKPTLIHNLKLLGKNKPLLLIVLSGVLGAAKSGFTYTGGLYFAKYVLNNEGLYTWFVMSVIPGGLIATLLVPMFTRKIGKKWTYIVSHIIGGVALLVAYFVGIAYKGDYTNIALIIIMFIAFVFAGIPFGFSNILTYAMIGDTVEYLEWKTGERAEGICYAMQTFISKIGMALGAFFGVLAYHMAGVTPNNPGALDAAGKDTMWWMLMLLGGLSCIAAAIPIIFYQFTEKKQQEAVAEIRARRGETVIEDAGNADDSSAVETDIVENNTQETSVDVEVTSEDNNEIKNDDEK
ncbi:MAG: glycoside-pentoside-hexuronide (GPH):cation symporter [Clostridia bacterium]|nr:glycoside-pentoside-hexuronide (GPH):cation symporter [Clostridia bacterium]